MNKIINLKEAIETLRNALEEDLDYRYTWQANIAMAFKDEWQRSVDDGGLPCTPQHIHEIANDAADNFLTLLCADGGNNES